MKIVKKYNLIGLFLVAALFCSFQPVYAGTRAILSSKVKITDGTNTATLNPQGHQKVTQDTQTLVLNRYLAKFHEHDTTLSAVANADDTAISIQAADYADFDIGDRLFINFGILEENSYPIITAKPGSPVLTLNKPLDKTYPIGSEVQHIVVDASSEVGTLANSIIYRIKPPPGITYHLRQGIVVLEHQLAGDSSKFGSISGLLNGITIRASINGIIATRTNIRTNLDFEDDTGRNIQYNQRAPGGKYGTIVTYDFAAAGVYIPLNGDTGDSLWVLIQDDISGLDIARAKFHGYITINQ